MTNEEWLNLTHRLYDLDQELARRGQLIGELLARVYKLEHGSKTMIGMLHNLQEFVRVHPGKDKYFQEFAASLFALEQPNES
jgi:hypothetical protein